MMEIRKWFRNGETRREPHAVDAAMNDVLKEAEELCELLRRRQKEREPNREAT